MATYSPTVIAYPNGTATTSGVFLPGAGTHLTGEGIATGIGSIGFIECNGYDECHLMPLGGATGDTPTLAVFAFYGDRQNGGVNRRYTVKLLLSMTNAGGAGGFSINWDGTTYFTKNPTVTAAYTNVLDGTVGCTTTTQAGTGTLMGTVGIAHLGGADYIAVTTGGGSAGINMLVRFA